MDGFFDRLIARAATLDELLSDGFEPLPGQKGDAELASRRLAAWCKSCASGDWSLFNRRLARDQLSIDQVLAQFATVRRRAQAPMPAWASDAAWIESALQSSGGAAVATTEPAGLEACPFEHLFSPVVQRAGAQLFADFNARVVDN